MMKAKDPLSPEAQHEIDLYLQTSSSEDVSSSDVKTFVIDSFSSEYQKPSRQRRQHSGKKDRRRDSDNW